MGESPRPGQLGISTKGCILIRQEVLFKGVSLLFFLSQINLRLIIITDKKFVGTFIMQNLSI